MDLLLLCYILMKVHKYRTLVTRAHGWCVVTVCKSVGTQMQNGTAGRLRNKEQASIMLPEVQNFYIDSCFRYLSDKEEQG